LSANTGLRDAALAGKLGLDFPLIADPDRTLIRGFGVEDQENEIAWPAIYVIGRDGKVAWRWLATSYKERPTADQLLEALAGL